MHSFFPSFTLRAAVAAMALAVLAGCAGPRPDTGLRETLVAVTASHDLITFHAAQPDRILERRPVTGLAPGERLVGIDFRVAKGVLYALSQAGRLYTLDIPTGALRPVGPAPAALAWPGAPFSPSWARLLMRSRIPLMNAPEFCVEKRLPSSIASLIATFGGTSLECSIS